MADDADAYGRQDSQPEGAQAAKKRSFLNALIVVLVPVLGVVLPRSYRAFAPSPLLIPLAISLANKLRQVAVQSVNPAPNQNNSMHGLKHDRSSEPHFYAPKDAKDPRRYKPIG